MPQVYATVHWDVSQLRGFESRSYFSGNSRCLLFWYRLPSNHIPNQRSQLHVERKPSRTDLLTSRLCRERKFFNINRLGEMPGKFLLCHFPHGQPPPGQFSSGPFLPGLFIFPGGGKVVKRAIVLG